MKSLRSTIYTLIVLILSIECFFLIHYLSQEYYPFVYTKITHKKETYAEIRTSQTIYGYSSTVDQTDSSPFITANGTRVRHGIIANNCYNFGQYVEILGEQFTVEDRMNSKYGCDVWDIWFPSREEANQWGKRILTVKIINN